VPSAPAQTPPAAEEGFILIEVLVSAVVLALVAAGVLALLSATTRSSASERVHSQAYGVAQEDQARMRSLRISSLNRLEQKREVKLDGSKFTVESTGVFVDNATGDESCTEDSSPADYVRVTSTVSSAQMGNPVVVQSVVSPSNGSLDPSHGTLSFSASNAAGQPLSGVSISGGGVANFNGRTDSTGCANFADLAAGNYSVTTSAAGMVNMLGETTTSKTIGVSSAGTQTIGLRYDVPGKIEPRFQYRVGGTATMVPTNADSILVYNAEMGTLGRAYWTADHSRQPTVAATGLFPFIHPDTVYAGACEKNNPVPTEGAPARASVLVTPNGTATPLITLPALNLTVKRNSNAVSGATVKITDEECDEPNGHSVKRTYTTEAGGHLTEPGMPWGIYSVCASGTFKEGSNNVTRYASKTKVSVKNLTSGTPLELELSSTSSC
jgi:Tfp pilus assembly protein PilV